MASSQSWYTDVTTMTVDTNAYSQYDVIGGLQTITVESATGSGQIQAVQFFDADNEKAALDFIIFDALPTTIADDAAVGGLVIADIQKHIVHKSIAAADWKNAGAGTLAWVTVDISPVRPFWTKTGKLYMYVYCTATPTYTAATDLSYRLRLLLD